MITVFGSKFYYFLTHLPTERCQASIDMMFYSKKTFSMIFPLRGLRLILVLVTIGTLMLLSMQSYKQEMDNLRTQLTSEMSYWSEEVRNETLAIEDVFRAKFKPPPGRTIFFHETKIHPPNSKYLINFTERQACAIESAALHNPDFQVFVLFAWPEVNPRSDPIIDAILSYKNVHFRRADLMHMAEGTPIEDWLKKGNLVGNNLKMFNISDLLRLLSLYRFGGIYLDMDVVLLRSLADIPLNYVGAEVQSSVGNSVISLEPDGYGHHVGELFLRNFQENYDGDTWAHNGPACLVRVLSKLCDTTVFEKLPNSRERCKGFEIFNINAFYAINWLQWEHFFEEKYAEETLARLKDSYLIHLWNHVNADWPLKTDSSAAYIQLARQHCPRVLAASGKHFI